MLNESQCNMIQKDSGPLIRKDHLEPAPNSGTFQCSICGLTFEKKWPDEDALKEKEALFGDIPIEACELVCDVCFNELMESLNS